MKQVVHRLLSSGAAFHAPSVSATASPPPSDHPRLLRPSLHLWLSFITAAVTTTTQHRPPVLRILPPSPSPGRLGAALQPLGIGMTTHRFASPALSRGALPPLSPQHLHPMPPLTTLPKSHPRHLHANPRTAENGASTKRCRRCTLRWTPQAPQERGLPTRLSSGCGHSRHGGVVVAAFSRQQEEHGSSRLHPGRQ